MNGSRNGERPFIPEWDNQVMQDSSITEQGILTIMNRIKLTLALVLTGECSELCSNIHKRQNDGRAIHFTVNDVLVPYVQTYVSAMNGDGWDLSSIRDTDVFIIFDYDLGSRGNRQNGRKGWISSGNV